MLFKHPDFLRVVEDNWWLPIHGDPLFVLGMKLKRLKEYLKSWNKNVFGNVISMEEQADEEVQQCEAAYESSSDPVLREALHQRKAKHLRCLAIQEDFFSQQSSIKWLQEGDKKTGFYHNCLRKKRKKSAILGIMDEGREASRYFPGSLRACLGWRNRGAASSAIVPGGTASFTDSEN
ncbi:hypothetical protein LIER_05751 [Lithospermum erythrorhizon]|uniref:Uncharacterized protein n=1 Tax=Lithospermum erythrorhizon TaxID=34254 RepID=A0AAV3P6K6_LITER